MTIAMIGQKGLPARSGGVDKHVELLAKGLVTRGHRVITFGRAWYVQNQAAPAGVEQYTTPGIQTKNLDAITHSFTAVLRAVQEDPDIVHIHGVGIALLAPLVRLLMPQAKLVVTFHSMDRRFDKWGFFAKLMFRVGEWFTCYMAHEVIAVSQEIARYCAKTYGRRTTYVSHAFSVLAPEPMSTMEARVEALGLMPRKYLLCVGRLIQLKGADRFLQAYTWAKATHPELFRDVQAVVVGGSSFTDDYVKRLSEYAASIPGAVLVGERFNGELRALQTCALSHVFPSTDEGLSLAVLEAASTARPLIMHDLEANHEAVGEYADFIDARSIEALGQAMVRVVEQSEAERQIQATRAQAYVASMYEPIRSIDTVDALYRELLGEADALTTPLSGVLIRNPA